MGEKTVAVYFSTRNFLTGVTTAQLLVSLTSRFATAVPRSLHVHVGLSILHGEEQCGPFRPVGMQRGTSPHRSCTCIGTAGLGQHNARRSWDSNGRLTC